MSKKPGRKPEYDAEAMRGAIEVLRAEGYGQKAAAAKLGVSHFVLRYITDQLGIPRLGRGKGVGAKKRTVTPEMAASWARNAQRRVKIGDQEMLVAEWLEKLGLTRAAFYYRLRHWTHDEILQGERS